MAVKIDPFLGLSYGEDKGGDDWNVWMDTNLVKLGMVVNIGVESATTTTPQPVVNGQRWLIPVGATGIWAGEVGQIACAIEGTYTYLTPSFGWRVTTSDTKVFYVYDGSSWVDEDDYGTL